jgi:hypothetical protein
MEIFSVSRTSARPRNNRRKRKPNSRATGKAFHDLSKPSKGYAQEITAAS